MGKAAGESDFKIGTLPSLPDCASETIKSLLQTMWKLAIIPGNLVSTILVLVPKPTGGLRGISLMEEMLKVLDSLLLHRMNNGLLPGRHLGEFISDLNRAYKKGMSTSDILHQHCLTLEDAMATNNDLLYLQSDLEIFF